MTAPSASCATQTGEEEGADLANVVDLVVARLCPGMSRTEALRVLAAANDDTQTDERHPVAETASTMLADAKRNEMVDHFIRLIIMLERGLPAAEGVKIAPHQRALLEAAAGICLVIKEPYWRRIALSLRAECLYLLSTADVGAEQAKKLRADAIHAAEASLQSHPPTPGLHPVLEDREAYNRDIIAGKTPPVTTRLFLQKLSDELVSPPATHPAVAVRDENEILVSA